jgi:hypothetical protein
MFYCYCAYWAGEVFQIVNSTTLSSHAPPRWVKPNTRNFLPSTKSGQDQRLIVQRLWVTIIPLVEPDTERRALGMFEGKEYIQFDIDSPYKAQLYLHKLAMNKLGREMASLQAATTRSG